MWVRPPAKDIEAVQKILGEPIAVGLTDRAWRARTQLLVVSLVAIGVVWFKLRVDTQATVFGFSLTGLTDRAVHDALGLAVAYLLVHFIWMAWESFAEWRLRLTGTRVAFVTAGIFGNEEADYPRDPRQSTLANWWGQSAPRVGNLSKGVGPLIDMLAAQEAAIREACLTGNPINVDNATALLGQVRQAANELKGAIESMGKTLRSLRIPASLDRFDQAYRHFLTSQNVRWLLLDALLPIGMAILALILLWPLC
jgi:hypothetical protein